MTNVCPKDPGSVDLHAVDVSRRGALWGDDIDEFLVDRLLFN